jgi:hypothetical protein
LFVLFLFAIVFVFLRYTASDYPFGIFKLLVRLNLSSLHNSLILSVAVNCRCPNYLILPPFVYNCYILLDLYTSWICMIMCHWKLIALITSTSLSEKNISGRKLLEVI